jgi:enoyl-CoA hydratase
MAIAAKSAKFVNAFHNAGTGSEGGLSYLLPRAVGTQRATELLLTARPVLAEEAERIGLVLRTVPDDQLMSAVLEVAEAIVANAPLDTWLTKQNLNHNLHAGSFEQAIAFETRASAMASTTEDAQEKRLSRREKRAPVFRSL